jgi:hypothetical protein
VTFDGSSWGSATEVSGASLPNSPLAAIFNSDLYVLHLSNSNDGKLYYNYFNGSSWAGENAVPGVSMSGSPGALGSPARSLGHFSWLPMAAEHWSMLF